MTAAGLENLFAQTTHYMDPKEMSLNHTGIDRRDEAPATAAAGGGAANPVDRSWSGSTPGPKRGAQELRDTLKQNIKQLEKENQLQ